MAFVTWPRNGFTLVRRDDEENLTRNYPAPSLMASSYHALLAKTLA